VYHNVKNNNMKFKILENIVLVNVHKIIISGNKANNVYNNVHKIKQYLNKNVYHNVHKIIMSKIKLVLYHAKIIIILKKLKRNV